MGKKKRKHPWVLVLDGKGLVSPGLYPREQVQELLKGGNLRVRHYGTRGAAIEAMRALGMEPPPKSPPEPPSKPSSKLSSEPAPYYLAVVDGSYRDGNGSASAVLLDPRLGKDGQQVALARAAFPWALGSGDAEVRAWLLALALAPSGRRISLESDFLPLVEAWRGNGKHPGLERVALALKALAEALGVEMEVRKAPRKEVVRAHQEAGEAREALPQEERLALFVRQLLGRLPARYRMAAVELLERYPGGEPLMVWLGRGNSETRRLLLGLLEGSSIEEQEALVRAVRSMSEAMRRGLKGLDREEAWESMPPTEKQLAFLRNLGYRGPEPGSLAEASRLIESLLGRGRKEG